MAKTSILNVRLDPATKANAEEIYSNLGITLSDAVNVFLRQSILDGGFPFRPRQPKFNDETEEAIREAYDILAGKSPAKRYSSAHELFEELNSEGDD